VKQFARLANRLNFLYVYTIIERNKRLYLPQRRSALHGGVDTHFMTHSTTQDSSVQHNGDQNTDVAASITQALDSFFPFDPYRLAQSSVYITPLYKEWEEEDDDIEEQEGDDFDEESGYQDEDNDNDVGDDEDSPTTPTSTKAGVDIPPAIDLPHQPASGIMSARLRAELNQGNAQSFSDSVLAMSISPQTHILDAQRQALLFNND
jgi:RNA polymerase I-specific transcription initiation factor RRN3